METYEVLERALALIEDRENWRRGNEGMDGGSSVCAEGAIGRVLGIPGREYSAIRNSPASQALLALVPGSYGSLWEFNDTHPHAEVVALFQEAIRIEKAKAGVLLPDDERVAEHV